MFGTTHMRGLTPEEIALFPKDFKAHIDIARLRLIGRAHNPLARGKILVRGYDIYWKDYPSDFAQEPLSIQSLLMHELCHVWQYATKRLTAWTYLTQPKNWIYGYAFDPNKSFDDYAIETQADLLQDWYYMNHGTPPRRYSRDGIAPNLAQINVVVPFKWDISPIDSPEEQDFSIV